MFSNCEQAYLTRNPITKTVDFDVLKYCFILINGDK